jgi:hypothetical protein
VAIYPNKFQNKSDKPSGLKSIDKISFSDKIPLSQTIFVTGVLCFQTFKT